MKRASILVLFGVTLLALVLISPTLAGSTERVLVEFAPGSGAAVKAALQGVGGQIHYEFDDLRVVAVSLPSAALENIRKNPNVVSIEADGRRSMAGEEVIPWGVDTVQAPLVWPDGDGSGVTVCIIDSGFYVEHEDLSGLPVTGTNVKGTGDWFYDACGHGTHVAGTIAALHGNDVGVVGVAPGVNLHIVKVFGDDCLWAYSSTLMNAANICAEEGANIISMSLSGPKPSQAEQRTFDALYAQGILSVAAAGNDANTEHAYPASYDSVISVAATDSDNVVADFSQQTDQVELAAPGVGVMSTVPYIATNWLLADGSEYDAHQIEYAALGEVTADMVQGGLCGSTADWEGKVVLCERGDFSFYEKVMNVQNSGGVAAVIYNNEPGNFYGTLGDGNTSDILAISISQDHGLILEGMVPIDSVAVHSSLEKPASGYEAWDGTSMATPHVAAVAALLWSTDLDLSPAAIREAMDQTALDLGDPGRDNAYGYGLVQAYDALQALEPSGGGEETMRVSYVKMWYVQRGRNYDVYTEVMVVAPGYGPVSGATVELVTELPDGTAEFAGVTDDLGRVTFSLRSRLTGTYTSTVLDVTHDTFVYEQVGEDSETLVVP